VLSKLDRKSNELRRKRRIRKKVFGTAERPRLAVYRSNKHMYVQIIDDIAGKTLVSASTLSPEIKGNSKGTGTVGVAAQVGTLLARKALDAKVKKVVFDRNSFRFHGRVKALAEAARQGGLDF
jgi:large subunit ribosomal protein L18